MKKYFSAASIYNNLQEPTTQDRTIPEMAESNKYNMNVTKTDTNDVSIVPKYDILGAFILLVILAIVLHVFR